MNFKGTYINTSVSNTEIQKAIRDVKSYQVKTIAKIDEAINKSTKAVGRGARQGVAVYSGRLKKRIRARFVKKETLGIVSARTPYAHILEGGAKATVVDLTKKGSSDKKGKIMRLRAHGGGGTMFGFRRKVSIPQRRGKPFMKPAYEKEIPNLLKNIEEAAKP